MDLHDEQPEPVHFRNREQCPNELRLRPGRQHDLPPRGRDKRMDTDMEWREPHGRDVQGQRPPYIQVRLHGKKSGEVRILERQPNFQDPLRL